MLGHGSDAGMVLDLPEPMLKLTRGSQHIYALNTRAPARTLPFTSAGRAFIQTPSPSLGTSMFVAFS